jgi:uncharacterized iron-regulated protein
MLAMRKLFAAAMAATAVFATSDAIAEPAPDVAAVIQTYADIAEARLC